MKKYSIIISLFFVLLSFINCNNNNNKNEKIEVVKLPPPPKIIDENSLIGFACYYSGRKSEPVEILTVILEKKRFNELKNKLYSNKPAEKYLATYSCIKLLEKALIELNNNELNQIKKNKQSNEKIYFCGGCTQNESYKMSQLFTEKIEFTEEVKSWFNEIKK